MIARSSQPEVGWLGWRNSEDEDLLKALSDACSYDRGETTMIDSPVSCSDPGDEPISPVTTKVHNKTQTFDEYLIFFSILSTSKVSCMYVESPHSRCQILHDGGSEPSTWRWLRMFRVLSKLRNTIYESSQYPLNQKEFPRGATALCH